MNPHLFYLFEKAPELLQRNLAIPICIQLGHEGLQLHLAHVATQLAQLTGVYRARVVLVNSLKIVNNSFPIIT